MGKTVLITGASSGIGKETAKYFASKGWNVVATMRRPELETDLVSLGNVYLKQLDVTDTESIRNVVEFVIKKFETLDVLINNAGYGAVGVFEAATPEQIKKQFDTNVFGVMNTIREVLPHFRAKRDGTIINVTSMGGLITFPIYSLYHGTKWAVEGFAEALSFELRQFNIKIKNIEPGAIKTDFYTRSQDLFKRSGLNDYDDYLNVALENTQKAGKNAPGPEVVAKMIYKAANDDNYRLRYPVGSQAPFLLFLRRIIPNCMFMGMVRKIVEKGFKG